MVQCGYAGVSLCVIYTQFGTVKMKPGVCVPGFRPLAAIS